MPHNVRHVASHRAHIRTLEIEIGVIGELIKPERSFHEKFVVVDAQKLPLVLVEFVLDFAHELFEHIVQRHDSEGAAKLVHHEREMRVPVQKELQQPVERHHLRHRHQIAPDRAQIGVLLPDQCDQILDVNEAESLVGSIKGGLGKCPLTRRGSSIPTAKRNSP